MNCPVCGVKGGCRHPSKLIRDLQALVKALEGGQYNTRPTRLVQGSCHCTDPNCKHGSHGR